MRAEVTRDTSHREITVKVTEGQAPDLDVTESWHRRTQLIRPDRVVLIIVDGDTRSIEVSGLQVKKDGSPGLQRGKRYWTHTGRALIDRDRIENAPAWVRLIWQEAPPGLTEWSFSLTDPR